MFQHGGGKGAGRLSWGRGGWGKGKGRGKEREGGFAKVSAEFASRG